MWKRLETMDIKKNNLKKIRIKEGLKKAQLARLAQVSSRMISDIEDLKSVSTAETKSKIIIGLNKNLDRTQEWKYGEVFPFE